MSDFETIVIDLSKEQMIVAITAAISSFSKESQSMFNVSTDNSDDEIMKAAGAAALNEGILIAIKTMLDRETKLA